MIKKIKKGLYSYKSYEPKNEEKLIVDLSRHGIMNRGKSLDNLFNSEVEILMRLSNPTNEPIGISKIIVNSKEKGYNIAVSTEDYENRKEIFSVYLMPKKTMMIRLLATTIPISMDKKSIDAIINFYDVKDEIIKSIPIKLSIGYLII
jgi:hypothetical protein